MQAVPDLEPAPAWVREQEDEADQDGDHAERQEAEQAEPDCQLGDERDDEPEAREHEQDDADQDDRARVHSPERTARWASLSARGRLTVRARREDLGFRLRCL